jgi:catechol 2,3-dioxygenase-like lactoylglutathione lyase family enzyme
MTLATLTPILTTDDMNRSVRFYVDRLGFICGVQTPGYSNLYRDAVRIILAAPNAHGQWKGPNFTGQLYIGMESADEVDALWASVKDIVDVVYAVNDFDYGMHEFAIRDDNGYSLAFGAPLKASYSSGLRSR